jgi:signal transduction histidine kinase
MPPPCPVCSRCIIAIKTLTSFGPGFYGILYEPAGNRHFNAILITAITLSIIIAYFLISIIRQQRRNLALQRENILAEVNAMERERERIANDLHDDVSPILSVIRFQINSIAVKNTEDEEQILQASEHLDNLIQRLRDISNNLMPIFPCCEKGWLFPLRNT